MAPEPPTGSAESNLPRGNNGDPSGTAGQEPIQNIALDAPAPIIRGANNRMLFEDARVLERRTTVGLIFPEPVFQAPASGDFGPLTVNEHTLAAIEVHADPSTVRRFIASEAERMALPLPGGRDDVVKVDKTITRGVHTYTLIGRLESDPLSEVTLVFHDGAVSGTIADQANNRHYRIGMSGDGDVAIRLLDLNTLPDACGIGADELVATGSAGVAAQSDAYEAPAGATVMDSVIGYGRGARIQEGGVAAIEATIVAAVDRLNEAIINSEAGNNFVALLGTIEDPDYVFPGVINGDSDSDDELGYLDIHGDGILDTVSQLRIDLGADHNGFIIKQPDGTPGVARVDGRSMIVAVNYLNTFNRVFSHEFGHNLSCMHAFGDTSGDKNRNDLGWRFDPVSTNGRSTIMAYTNSGTWGNGGRVNHFSNPAVQYDGVNTGAVDGYDASSDPTVDEWLVDHPTYGSGFDGSHPNLGANNAQEIINNTTTMKNRATRTGLGVVDPVAAATWTANQPYSIFWTGGDHTDTISIDLYKGGVFDSSIASGISGQNRWYTWTIPGTKAAGADYTVRVTLNGTTYSESAAFSIAEATFTGILWDGGAGTSEWTTATNWGGTPDNTVPTTANDVKIDSTTGLRTGWISDSSAGSNVKNLIIDLAEWGWRPAGAGRVFNVYGSDTTFTNVWSDANNRAVFSSSNAGTATWRLQAGNNATHTITNNSAGEDVKIFAGTSTNQASVRANNNNETLRFAGLGTFSIERTTFQPTLGRIWTADGYAGSVTFDTNSLISVTTDVRTQGGVIKIQGSNRISDGVQLAFGGTSPVTREFDVRGLSDTANVLSDFSSTAGSNILRVDSSTAVVFTNLRFGASALGIDILGWVEGSSSLVFTSLGAPHYAGTVAEGAAFVGLTIGGQPAYLKQVPDVNGDTIADWAVQGVLRITGTFSLSGNDQVGDNMAVILDGGVLDPNGFSDAMGTLDLDSTSIINLTNGGSVAFANSSALGWAGTLNVTGPLTATSIRFGTDATGLTADQLRNIRIGDNYARLDSNGYLQPIFATPTPVSGDNSGINYQLVGGGNLNGTGTVGSIDAAALASVSPGNSGTPIATLNVAGNVDMEAASSLLVDASRSGGVFSNDTIAASGSVSFFGNIDLTLSGEPLQAGDEITIFTGTVPMPTYRNVPAQVVVNPASPTPLSAGLELVPVYHSNKITVLARSVPAANILRNGEFEQGSFFWDTSGSGGTFSIDSSVPDSGPTCMRVDITSASGSWSDFQLFQHFRVQQGQQYTITFRYRVTGQNPGDTNELAVSLSNSKLTRDFTNPAIGTFGPAGVNAPAIDSWQTYTRTFTAGATDAASLNILFGRSETGSTIRIDDVRVTTTGPYPEQPTTFRVTGYLPAYRFGSGDLIKTNPEFFKNLDTLIYGFVSTDANGSVIPSYQSSPGGTVWSFTQNIKDTLQSVKSAYGVELLVALGGGGVSATVFFEDVNSDPSKRATLITNLISFCNSNGFDGVDLDFEYPAASTNQQENYELFVEEAKAAFAGAKTGGGNLVLTAALDTFSNAYYPPDAYTAHRDNHMMNYAMDYDAHTANILQLFNAGAPMISIFPGIIWSGDNGSTTTTYKSIYDLYAPAPHETTAGGWTFNGIDGVRQKIQQARALGCGGVMIWELGQDSANVTGSLMINAVEDADRDALLDKWEQQNSGGINLRPWTDDDADGLWNLWENLTGTDPLDASSRSAPQIDVQNLSGSDYMAVSFPYVNPLRFSLIASVSNDLTVWSDLDTGPDGNALAEESAGILTIRQTNPIGSPGSYGFMRMETQVAP